MTNICVRFPFRLVSEANTRCHWSHRAARARAHRNGAKLLIPARDCTLPATVTITRIAPRALDDDNLAISAKSLRDGIADQFGVPDNDHRLTWRYAQRRGKPREYAVIVEIV